MSAVESDSTARGRRAFLALFLIVVIGLLAGAWYLWPRFERPPARDRVLAAAGAGRCLRRGRPAGFGIAVYERFLSARWLRPIDAGGWHRPRILFRMGELYEQRGDQARAADYYSQFAELWRGADPDLQPRVAEARRRLAALTAEPGRP